MKTYYHGTSYDSAKAIAMNGIEVTHYTGNTFGKGLYLCEHIEDAKTFGLVVLSVTVDDTNLTEIYMAEESIQYENDEWSRNFSNGFLKDGYQIAKIAREDGFNEIVVFDVSCVQEVQQVWESPIIAASLPSIEENREERQEIQRRSLWDDTFTLQISITDKRFSSFTTTTSEEKYTGSLRDAIRYVLKKFDTATVSFYTSDGTWLKEIGW